MCYAHNQLFDLFFGHALGILMFLLLIILMLNFWGQRPLLHRFKHINDKQETHQHSKDHDQQKKVKQPGVVERVSPPHIWRDHTK